MKSALTWASAILGLISAGLWWWASVVKVDAKKYAAKIEEEEGWAPAQVISDGGDVVEGLRLSARWNSIAAIVTGLSVAAGAVANLVPG